MNKPLEQLENRCLERILKFKKFHNSKLTIEKLKSADKILDNNLENILIKLKDQNLIQMNDYKNIKLTQKGLNRYQNWFMN